jgi:hypothetical protein
MTATGIVVVLVFSVLFVGWIAVGVIRSGRRELLLDLPALTWRVFFALWLIVVAVGVVAVITNPLMRFVPALRHCGVH